MEGNTVFPKAPYPPNPCTRKSPIMRFPLRILALLLSLTLVAAACGDDDPVESSGSDSASASEPADDMADEMTEEDDAADELGTIVDVAVGAGSFETLVAAVTEAGLVDTLSGEGPFTVFAPTDDAFAAALDALGLTASELLASEALGDILTYHVVAGAVDAATAISLDGQSAATVQGEEIAISVVDGSVVINDSATVIQADVAASNGIIHVIDAVILPPTIAEALLGDPMEESDEAMADEADETVEEEEVAEELGTIVEVAAEAGIFTTLLAAGDAAGLSPVLDAPGDYTIFAPTDDAFAAALEALGLTAEELLADTATLTSILTYHGLLGSVDAAAAIALDGQSVATINSAEIAISVVDGNVVINDTATVIQADVAASNGIIHVIDAVLLPPAG